MRGDVIHSSAGLPGDLSFVGDRSETVGREQCNKVMRGHVTINGSSEEVKRYQKGEIIVCGWHILEGYKEDLG